MSPLRSYEIFPTSDSRRIIPRSTFLKPPDFRLLLRHLRTRLGPQHWWPARTPFEVCVGAILTQNTAWGNVERAIANLRRKGRLSARALQHLPRRALARQLRPSGYFNLKAHRLQSFIRFFMDEFGGSIPRLRRMPDVELRHRLLGVNGIGRETADSILCYALEKPLFVVDAYTRRIFSCHGWIQGHEDYDAIRALVETSWRKQGRAAQTRAFNELHALLVAVGKDFCRPSRPDCARCPLGPCPPAALRAAAASSNR